MSDSINLSLRITQNGKTVEGAQIKANFHLEESEQDLCFYLPKDDEDRELCYERQLPRRMREFLNITDRAAESVIGSIFRRDKPHLIDRILDDAGIGQVSLDFTALDAEYAAKEPELKSLIALTQDMNISSPPSEQVRMSEHQSSGYYDRLSPSLGVYRGQSSAPSAPPPEPVYKKILENVVNIARKRANYGILDTGGGDTAEPIVHAVSYNTTEVFSSRFYERDFKIGAAGELYVRVDFARRHVEIRD